jgi:hypothetical protein
MSLQQAREAAPEMGGFGTHEHERSMKAVRRDPNATTKMMRNASSARPPGVLTCPAVTKLIGCKHRRTAFRPASQ